MEELKPCPFCGGMARMFEITSHDGLRVAYEFIRPYYRIVCQGGCGSIMGDFGTMTEAVEAWNKRAGVE